MINVLKDIPYRNEGMGNRKVADEKYVQIMQIALKPEQNVPQHKANSNVHLLILEGLVSANLDGVNHNLAKGDLLPVAFQTTMHIKNIGQEDATFLVIKTPNPSEMVK